MKAMYNNNLVKTKKMMKLLFFMLLITNIFANYAQIRDENLVYVTAEFNIGNYKGFDLNLNMIDKKNYSYKIGILLNIRKPKSQPDDYTSGAASVFLLGLGDPYDSFVSYQISFGKIYNLNEMETIRVNVSAGLAYTKIREPENWQYTGGFLDENYTWNYKKNQEISLIINPKIEFPFIKYYGLTLSPMLQINKKRTYFGIGIGKMIGLLK